MPHRPEVAEAVEGAGAAGATAAAGAAAAAKARSRRAWRIAATLAAAIGAGALFAWLATPLPWMLGPLFLTAILGVAGAPLAASYRLRNVGQWVIGVALGLYFTPEVVALVLRLAPALLVGVVWALLIGYGFYRWLLWANPEMERDRAGAFFAAAIGGASEMALLAERHGAAADRVAAAHSLRVLLVVALVPFGFQALGVQGADPAQPGELALRPAGLALLAAASAIGMWVLWRMRVPNPWVLGALAATALLTATEVPLSALPPWASPVAQVFIGVSLGCRFTPQFARAAPRWLATVALGTVAMIVASAALAWGLAYGVGLHPATVMLGTAPGGIAEMCITAKVLQLGVPVVTAFHVTRYVVVLTLTGPLFRWEIARRRPMGQR